MDIVEQLLKVALFGSAWVLWLLLALSVVSIGVLLERAWTFARVARRGGAPLREQLLRLLQGDDADAAEVLLRDSGTWDGRAVAAAFVFREGGSHAFSEAVDAELARSRGELERGLTFLGTIGNNAPFIGLFGTVIGVIVAFHELGSAAARAGAMGSVMAGIAEALVATGVGLFVAIPAVVAYNVISKRVADLEDDARSLGKLVSAWIETHERGGKVRAAAPLRVVAPLRDERPAPALAGE